MIGMDRTTGRQIAGEDHLRQSITDILTTPIGSRVMRREYGSDLPALIDAPINSKTIVDVFQAAAEAIGRWEPRIRLRRVQVSAAEAGRMTLILEHEAGTLDVEIGQ